MGYTKEGEKPVGLTLPTDLVNQVEGYRFDRRLPTVKEAYRELIENGLKAAKQEKEAPKG